jgi:hypothetical protein
MSVPLAVEKPLPEFGGQGINEFVLGQPHWPVLR